MRRFDLPTILSRGGPCYTERDARERSDAAYWMGRIGDPFEPGGAARVFEEMAARHGRYDSFDQMLEIPMDVPYRWQTVEHQEQESPPRRAGMNRAVLAMGPARG